MAKVKVIAFDLDGTLSQHKSPLPKENIAALDRLAEKYKLIMAGAGQCRRIFRQMNEYPIDIIGNYGLQYAEYCEETQSLQIRRDLCFPCDTASVEKRVTALRETFGYTDFAGNSVEYHPSGCITFAILGTAAAQADKLAFDPDRKKRRLMYEEVVSLFPEYRVFIGGSSSFDMAPAPYDKHYALDQYCKSTDCPTMRLCLSVMTTKPAATMPPCMNPISHSSAWTTIWIFPGASRICCNALESIIEKSNSTETSVLLRLPALFRLPCACAAVPNRDLQIVDQFLDGYDILSSETI